eukprot:12210317-Heterocapsa_arctica.AAC.1
MRIKTSYFGALGRGAALMFEIATNPMLEALKGNEKMLQPYVLAKAEVEASVNPFRSQVLAATSSAEIKKLEADE